MRKMSVLKKMFEKRAHAKENCLIIQKLWATFECFLNVLKHF